MDDCASGAIEIVFQNLESNDPIRHEDTPALIVLVDLDVVRLVKVRHILGQAGHIRSIDIDAIQSIRRGRGTPVCDEELDRTGSRGGADGEEADAQAGEKKA